MSFGLKLFSRPVSVLLRGIQEQREFHRWVYPTYVELKKRKTKLGPQPPVKRSDFIEWNYKAELYAFGQRLGENFKDNLLKQALLEESYLAKEQEKQLSVGLEPDVNVISNLTMEENGQEFIENYVFNYLRTTLPHLPVKYTESIKEYLLSDETHAHVAKHIGIDDIVLSGEFPPEEETLARSFRSVVHALVLSSGQDKAGVFIRDILMTQLAAKDLSPLCTPENPLEELAQTLQERQLSPPEPRLISAIGKNTILANYEVGIYSDKKLIGRGAGESAEIAQDMAACDALWRLWGVAYNKRPFPFNIELPLTRSKIAA